MVEVQDILLAYGDDYLAKHTLTPQQQKAFDDIRACRTAVLGGHIDLCPECGEQYQSYNSCRNRHCTKCQALRREEWVTREGRDLIGVGYYHLVFTVPHELNPVFYRNQKEMYNLLFRCSWATVAAFAADPKYLGAKTGAISVLHTWGRQVQYHPHVHMIVPAGGLTERGGWRHTGKNFFAPVRAMSKVFRAKLLEGVRALAGKLDLGGCAARLAEPGALESLVSSLFESKWVVYCKRPFAGASSVLAYLGRYTHRVAISNSRILSMEGGMVTFTYWSKGRKGTCTVTAEEFIRRFLMHVLPKGLAKVRHYGILASRDKRARLAHIRRLTRTPEPAPLPDRDELVRKMIGRDPRLCRKCGSTLWRNYKTLEPQLC